MDIKGNSSRSQGGTVGYSQWRLALLLQSSQANENGLTALSYFADRVFSTLGEPFPLLSSVDIMGTRIANNAIYLNDGTVAAFIKKPPNLKDKTTSEFSITYSIEHGEMTIFFEDTPKTREAIIESIRFLHGDMWSVQSLGLKIFGVTGESSIFYSKDPILITDFLDVEGNEVAFKINAGEDSNIFCVTVLKEFTNKDSLNYVRNLIPLLNPQKIIDMVKEFVDGRG